MAHRKHALSILNHLLILVRELIVAYCEEYTKHVNTMCDENKDLLIMSRHVGHLVITPLKMFTIASKVEITHIPPTGHSDTQNVMFLSE
jgi:hypothetical protein